MPWHLKLTKHGARRKVSPQRSASIVCSISGSPGPDIRTALIRDCRAALPIETVPDPACAREGVVLKLLACGISCADPHGWVGEYPKVSPRFAEPVRAVTRQEVSFGCRTVAWLHALRGR